MSEPGSGKRIAGFVTIGCGGLMLLIALGVTLFCAFHVFIDPHGAISDDEALPGLIGGLACFFFDFVPIIVGIFLARKKAAAAAGPGVVATPAGPGAPPMGAAPVGTPGVTASPAVKKPFPTQYISGCLTASLLIFVLGGVGVALYFFDAASGHERIAQYDEEEIRDNTARGEYVSPFLDPDRWRRRASEDRTYAYSGLGCSGFSILLMIGGIIASVSLAKKNRAKYQRALAAQGAQPPAGGGYGAPPPAGGGYGAPPPAGGGYGAPPPAGGGFGAPPPAGGGYGAPPPAGGGYGAPPH
jgi:hypothetical protein